MSHINSIRHSYATRIVKQQVHGNEQLGHGPSEYNKTYAETRSMLTTQIVQEPWPLLP